MKVAVAVAAIVGLGLVTAGCSSGLSATETAACGAVLKITLPPAAGGAGLGTNEAISIPTNLVESLIHFGDPTLARNGRAMAKPRSSKGFLVNIFGIAGRETSRPEGVDDDGRSTTWRKLAERLVHR